MSGIHHLNLVKASQFATGTKMRMLSQLYNSFTFDLLQCYSKFDVICLSETYLNSETHLNEEKLNVLDSNLIRADHLSNTERGEIRIFIKYHNECICFEVAISKKLCNFISRYSYLTNLAINLRIHQQFRFNSRTFKAKKSHLGQSFSETSMRDVIISGPIIGRNWKELHLII